MSKLKPCYYYTDFNIDTYVKCYVRNTLGGFRDADGYLLNRQFDFGDQRVGYVAILGAIDNSEGVINVDFFLNKYSQEGAVARDDRSDVFDELLPIMRQHQNCHVKILFPYNITNVHWLTGEITLHKHGNNVELHATAHDPYGRGELSRENFNSIRQAIDFRLSEEVGFKLSNKISEVSHFVLPRQYSRDGNSCGVIVAEEILKRAQGIDLTLDQPHESGTSALRLKQLQYLRDNMTDEKSKVTLREFEKDVVDHTMWDPNFIMKVLMNAAEIAMKNLTISEQVDASQSQFSEVVSQAQEEAQPEDTGERKEERAFQKKYQELKNTIDDGIKQIRESVGSQEGDNTILIGKTTSGKSTLLNYFVAPEETVVRSEKGRILVDGPIAKIGNSIKSQTVVPNRYAKYWDCPGFEDTKSEVQEIANAFFIREVFSLSKAAARLVFVVQWNDVENLGNFKALLGNIANLFPNSSDAIIPATRVIVTKVPAKQINYVYDRIYDLLSELGEDEHRDSRKIFDEYLKQPQSNHLVMPKIKLDHGAKEVLISDAIGSNEQMLSTISETNAIAIQNVGIAISHKAQLFAFRCADVFAEEINRKFSLLGQKYVDFLKSSYNKAVSLDELASLIQNNRNSVKEMRSIVDTVGSKLKESGAISVDAVMDIVKTEYSDKFKIDVSAEHEELVAITKILEFFQQVIPKFKDSNSLKLNLRGALLEGLEAGLKEIELFEGKTHSIICKQSEDAVSEIVRLSEVYLRDKVFAIFGADNIDYDEALKEMRNCQEFAQQLKQLSEGGYDLAELFRVAKNLEGSYNTLLVDHLVEYDEVVRKYSYSDFFVKFDYDAYKSRLHAELHSLRNIEKQYVRTVENKVAVLKQGFDGAFNELLTLILNIAGGSDLLKAIDVINASTALSARVNEFQKDGASFYKFFAAPQENYGGSKLFGHFLSKAMPIVSKLDITNASKILKDSVTDGLLPDMQDELSEKLEECKLVFSTEYEQKIANFVNQVYDCVTTGFRLFSDQDLDLLKKYLTNETITVDTFILLLRDFAQDPRKTELLKEALTTAGEVEAINNSLKHSVLDVESLAAESQSIVGEIVRGKGGGCGSPGWIEPVELEGFATQMIGKLCAVHKNSADLENIKKGLKHLISLLQKDVITPQEIMQELRESLKLEGLKVEDSVLESSFAKDRVKGSVNKMLSAAEIFSSWYDALESVHDVIVSKADLLRSAKNSQHINSGNFKIFLKSLSKHGLEIDEVFTMRGTITERAIRSSIAEQLNKLWGEHKSNNSNSGEFEGTTEAWIAGKHVVVDQFSVNFSETVKLVSVYSTGSVVFGGDIYKPGVTFKIFAPYVIVPKKITINLSGVNGESHFSKAASGAGFKWDGSGSDGYNGREGIKGTDSGSLYILTKGTRNLNDTAADKFPVIYLNGGEGGNGQSGGDGSVGYSGATASLNDFYSSGTINIRSGDFYRDYHPANCLRLINNHGYNREDLILGKCGYKGGDAGVGGKGGKGGKGGELHIRDLSTSSIDHIWPDGTQGVDGRSGVGGEGGMYGWNLVVWYNKTSGCRVHGNEPHEPGREYWLYNGRRVVTMKQAQDGDVTQPRESFAPRLSNYLDGPMIDQGQWAKEYLKNYRDWAKHEASSNVYDYLENKLVDSFIEDWSKMIGDVSPDYF